MTKDKCLVMGVEGSHRNVILKRPLSTIWKEECYLTLYVLECPTPLEGKYLLYSWELQFILPVKHLRLPSIL